MFFLEGFIDVNRIMVCFVWYCSVLEYILSVNLLLLGFFAGEKIRLGHKDVANFNDLRNIHPNGLL